MQDPPGEPFLDDGQITYQICVRLKDLHCDLFWGDLRGVFWPSCLCPPRLLFPCRRGPAMGFTEKRVRRRGAVTPPQRVRTLRRAPHLELAEPQPEDRNLLKLRSLDSSCPLFLSENSIWDNELK